MVGCSRLAVAEVPTGALARLAAADGVDAVARDGAGIGKVHVELAVANLHLIVEAGQRVAGTGVGRDGELAAWLVHKRTLAVVSDGVGLDLQHPRGTDGVERVEVCVPAVDEAGGSVEGVAVHIAAELALHVLLLAADGEVGVAVVVAHAAVARGEADDDLLARVGTEVHTDGGPVFPQHIVRRHIPAQRAVGHEVGGAALPVEKCVGSVENLQREAGLVGGDVQRVLEHRRIAQHEEVEVGGIDKERVGYGLGLSARDGAGAVPVAQSHGGIAALGDDAQLTSRADVVRRCVIMYRVTAGDGIGAIVDDADVGVGVGEGAVEAARVVGGEVGGVDATRAARRRKDGGAVAVVRRAVEVAAVAHSGEIELVVGQRVKVREGEGRLGDGHRRATALREAHRAIFNGHGRVPHLVPGKGDLIARDVGHPEVGSADRVNEEVIHIDAAPAATVGCVVAESQEAGIAWQRIECHQTAHVSIALTIDRLHRQERRGVGRVAQHTHRQTAARRTLEPEAQGQVVQAIHCQVGQYGIVGVVVIAVEVEAAIAAVGVAAAVVQRYAAAIALRVQEEPTCGQACRVAFEVFAQRQLLWLALCRHRLLGPAGQRQRVTAEVEVVGRSVLQRQVKRQAGAVHQRSCPLRKVCCVVLHPEASA